MNLGAGDDYLEIGGKLTANNAYLDGGDGQDALYLKDYTKQQYESDFVANYQSWRIKNFETITFKDVDTYKIDKDGKLGDKVEAKEYKYDITVNAQLTDTDGSESLSKDGNGNEIKFIKEREIKKCQSLLVPKCSKKLITADMQLVHSTSTTWRSFRLSQKQLMS